MSGRFDVALVCPSGHAVNSYSKTMPEFSLVFCEQCGGQAISNCPACGKPIRGSYLDSPIAVGYKPPPFCGECGAPFPWTESRLKAAHDLIEELEELSPDERARLQGSIGDLVRDSPQTTVAVTRVKKIALKIGKESRALLEKLLIDVASDTAKTMLGLP